MTLVTPLSDPCELAQSWKLSSVLARKLIAMSADLPFQIEVISGYRTAQEQEQLRKQGRPTAPDALSTHRTCPSTGADVHVVGVWPTQTTKAYLGDAANRAGLRWGGGSRLDDDGLPTDWNHVDLGPRT